MNNNRMWSFWKVSFLFTTKKCAIFLTWRYFWIPMTISVFLEEVKCVSSAKRCDWTKIRYQKRFNLIYKIREAWAPIICCSCNFQPHIILKFFLIKLMVSAKNMPILWSLITLEISWIDKRNRPKWSESMPSTRIPLITEWSLWWLTKSVMRLEFFLLWIYNLFL